MSRILQDQQAWYVDQHQVQQPATLDQVIDNRFVDRALAALGEYRP
jgi:hypothetical protein